MSSSQLARAVLAISAFRSDESVIALLERAFADEAGGFGQVLVVDSLGTGAIAEAIARNGWPATYINAERNLGSAGNLSLRLQAAAETGLDWCLTLNHDGELHAEKAAALIRCGQGSSDIGAVYPRLRLTRAGGRIDGPRTRFVPRAESRLAAEADVDVAWGSSNGALYNLDAVRRGLRTWPELWMGYEDLAIGWELAVHGWRQILCGSVSVDDNYEYRKVRFLGLDMDIVDKPAWYSYYHLRNLVLIRRASNGQSLGLLPLARRALLDVGLILFWKDSKRQRIGLLFKGLLDGMLGRGGKGPVP